MRLAFISGLALALALQSAQADVPGGRPEFNWTNPATWTNGQPLTTSQITGYQLNCSGGISVRVAPNAGVPPTTYPPAASPPLAAGTYSCTLAVYARETPTAMEVLGTPTNPINFTVPAPRPNAATGFSAN